MSNHLILFSHLMLKITSLLRLNILKFKYLQVTEKIWTHFIRNLKSSFNHSTVLPFRINAVWLSCVFTFNKYTKQNIYRINYFSFKKHKNNDSKLLLFVNVSENKMRSLLSYTDGIKADEKQEFIHNDFIRTNLWRDERSRSLTDC